MAEKTRWGIIGTGNIASQFARGLASLPDAQLVAVGSRSQESANAFGALFDVPRRYPTYGELAHDPDVDAVYVATPHSLHMENTLTCLEAGKAVLCEKPFAINAEQAAAMVRAARERGIFLMEAMWTRCLPLMVRVRELLAAGVIGEVRMVMADLGFRTQYRPTGRLFDPHLGGGGLLDVGVYPVSLASMVFGAPTRVAGLAHLGETGVDEQSAVVLGYDGGRLAVVASAVRTNTPQEAHLLGTEGRIHIHYPWWMPKALTLYRSGRAEEVLTLPFEGNGYNYEAAEVARCLRAGLRESELMPLDESLSIMRTLDQIRAQWGLKYPME